MAQLFATKIMLAIFVATSLWHPMSCLDQKSESSGRSSGSLIAPVGVVLDQTSRLGAMVELCMSMAIKDFYEVHSNYTTRLEMHVKNANDFVDVNFAVLELVNHNKVHGIIAPQQSIQATFLPDLGRKFHVPVISSVSPNSHIPYPENPYFVRTTPDDALQVRALAAICKKFDWRAIALLYENSVSGYQFLSDAIKEFELSEITIEHTIAISSSADNGDILTKLTRLATRQTRIFLVHVSPTAGFRLFHLAESVGIMSKGYAWLITDSLSPFMNSISPNTRGSMEGVIGIRPYIYATNDLYRFQERFKRNAMMLHNGTTTGRVLDLNIYGLWAYDVITALATAVERNAPMHDLNMSTNLKIIDEFLNTKFTGLSGEFDIVDRKLKFPGFEIFNVFGTGEKTIGFWRPERGIVREWESSNKMEQLKSVVWPGDSVKKPNGWGIPKILRVGIPPKAGFKEFVDPESGTEHCNATGFSIDIFFAARALLPFPIEYEFHCLNKTTNPNWTYDELIADIPQEFDMIVGDVTIWAPRAELVDFTLPYSESGAVLVVRNKKPFDMWIFIRPLKWDLWLAIFGTCIFMGIILRILEHNKPLIATQKEQQRRAYWSPIAMLAFPERNMVSNAWSLFVLVFWAFMAFILMQSYTANLSAILTLDQLKFAFSDDHYIGWQEGTFMKRFLTEHLHIRESKLKSYPSPEAYDHAMSLGSENGGIDAIFDELPYMKILMNKYDNRYKRVGPTYQTGGFGFAFPRGSPLVAHFSKAILEVTQSPQMIAIEQKNFGPGYSSQDPLSSKISQETSSLTLFDFGGLFIIIGSLTIFALLCSETVIGQILSSGTNHFLRYIFGVFKSPNENLQRDDSDGIEMTEERDAVNDENVLNNDNATIAYSTREDNRDSEEDGEEEEDDEAQTSRVESRNS